VGAAAILDKVRAWPALDPDAVAAFAFYAACLARCAGPESAPGLWPEIGPAITAVLVDIERRSGMRGLAAAALARMIMFGAPAAAGGVTGQIAATLNATFEMLEQLAREQRRITRELGVEGRLGGQAEVPGAAGAWADMVAALNGLGYALANELRRINAVAGAL